MWMVACGSPPASAPASIPAPAPAPAPASSPAPNPNAPIGYWPETAAEKNGQAYNYDPTVVATRACETKAPIELRLGARRTPQRTEVRLTIKNCTAALVRLLHGHNNPSLLSVAAPGVTLPAPSDDRRMEKSPSQIFTRDFARYAADLEQVAHEGYFIRSPDGDYGIKWMTHTHSGIKPGRYTLRVSLANTVTEGIDENKQQKVAVFGAWTGSVQSNEIAIELP
jgi:hypothetical protein